MNLYLEVVVVPVADVERAKAFYADTLGFSVDQDVAVTADYRVVQLTPPGSACSIVVQSRPPSGEVATEPGSLKGLQLCVGDLRSARAELAARGLEISDVQVMDPVAGGFRVAGDDDPLDFAGFAFFQDPDGNGWGIQQMPGRD